MQATRRWEDDLRLALVDAHGEERAIPLLRRYGPAFPVAYRDALSARAAVRDIAFIEALDEANPFAVSLYRPVEADARTLRLRVFRLGARLPLSASLPILENMGLEVLDEEGWEIGREGAPPVFLHDFGLRSTRDLADVEAIKAITEEALLRVARGEIENDAFNRLTPAAALAPDDVVVLRAYAKYLKQTGFTFSQAYIAQTLAAHPAIVTRLVALFHARFDPAAGAGREAAQQRLHDEVKDGAQRRGQPRRGPDPAPLPLRHSRDAAHQPLGARGGRPAGSPTSRSSSSRPRSRSCPEPRPLFEIFVYSPRFEAIHLRGGKVARGGLRWSDRPEDFRTEILGLMKAQMVKNAVIVPVGSKGGFVLKAAPAARPIARRT